jgi:OPT family oligopeptide transporter
MPFNLPSTIPLPFTMLGKPLAVWSVTLSTSLVNLGIGALMSLRTCASLFAGTLLTYFVLAPALVENGTIKDVSYKAIINWTLWPGASILVASGIVGFAFEWRSLVRAVAALAALLTRKTNAVRDALSDVECPDWWFPAGFAALFPIAIALMAHLFGVPVWAGLLALPLAIVLGFVAARVAGETDVVPTKALGPVTQVIYGALLPGNVTANIMSGNVTGGIGLHAADLLTDLKSGYLLGARPRPQFIGQLFGVVAGAFIVVPAFDLLVPDPSVLGSEALPAPSVIVWANVSKAFANGISALDPSARTAALVGLAIGVALSLVERFAPKRVRAWFPSASGFGLAFVLPASTAISMFVGSLGAEVLRRTRPAFAEKTVIPVASGVIAGESLMGVLVAALVVLGLLQK